MKTFIRKTAAALLTAVLAASTFSVFPVSAGSEPETEPKVTTITFDYDLEGVTVETDKKGEPLSIEDISGEVGSSEFLPKTQLVKQGYKFQGWTMNGLKGYAPGDVVQFPEEDAVMTPVFYCKDYEESHKAVYNCDFEGSSYDKAEVPSVYYAPEGKIITLSLLSLQREGYKHLGWYVDGDNYFRGGERIVMPNREIEIRPRWLKVCALTYFAGDYDRIVGATHMYFEQPESTSTELQTSTRFSRDGFKLVGWHCSADDKVYLPEETFTMPGEDIIMTAVWKPIDYKIVFNSGTGADGITRITGTTDTTITIPECTAEKAGYKFSGWKFGDEVYQPGDEYLVAGLYSGLGYAFNAVWVKDDSAAVTTTTKATTTTTTTTTTTETTTTISTATPIKQTTGDANCDGQINMADAVLIMQTIINPDKFSLTEQGSKNADVDYSGDVTNIDALWIQRYKMHIIADFSEATAPEKTDIIPGIKLGMSQKEAFKVLTDDYYDSFESEAETPDSEIKKVTYYYKMAAKNNKTASNDVFGTGLSGALFVEFNSETDELINYGYRYGFLGTIKDAEYPYSKSELEAAYDKVKAVLERMYGDGEAASSGTAGTFGEHIWTTDSFKIWLAGGVNLWASAEPESYEKGVNQVILSVSE